jgi:hypothetical protein
VDNEQLVQRVTAEVMRQMTKMPTVISSQSADKHPFQVLAIFTGGTIGCEQGLVQLQKLQELSYAITVVLSPAAERIVGIDQINDRLGDHISIVTTQSPCPGKVLQGADIVLLPVLTQNTAAKLAHTLADTLVTTLVMQALMQGKPVVAAINAADPTDGRRIKSNMGKVSPGLLQALRSNLQIIESYGVQLVQVDQLAAQCQKLIACTPKRSISSVSGKKSVVDAKAVEAVAGQGLKALTVAPGTIITPLARDIARGYGIEIVNEIW